jgi:hypothetical protein
LTDSYKFGDQTYAREELRAELASAFLAAERGNPHNPEQHAAYVGSWITALKEDKHEIFRAAHDATAATDYLLKLERDRSVADQALSDAPLAAGTGSRAIEQQAETLERDREDKTELGAHVEAEREEDREEGRPNDGSAASSTPKGKRDLVREDVLPTEVAPQESTKYAPRFEPGSSTVSVERKENGDSYRTPIDQHRSSAKQEQQQQIDPELAAVRGIAKSGLGPNSTTVQALTESGTYRGEIVGATDRFVVQRQSAQLAVVHQKEALDQSPEVGKRYSINYADGRANVRETRERAKAHELGR